MLFKGNLHNTKNSKEEIICDVNERKKNTHNLTPFNHQYGVSKKNTENFDDPIAALLSSRTGDPSLFRLSKVNFFIWHKAKVNIEKENMKKSVDSRLRLMSHIKQLWLRRQST